MPDDHEQKEELVLGARVCQTCRQPFVLVAKTDQQRLALHTRVMEAVVEQWQLPGYLVLPDAADAQNVQVVSISPGAAPRKLTQEQFAEEQESAFLHHRCPGR